MFPAKHAPDFRNMAAFAVVTLAVLVVASQAQAQVVIDMPAPPPRVESKPKQPAPSQTQPATQSAAQQQMSVDDLGVLAINRYVRSRTAPRFTEPAYNNVLLTGGYRSIDGLYYRPYAIQVLPYHTFSGFHHTGLFPDLGFFHYPFAFHHGFHGFGFHVNCD